MSKKCKVKRVVDCIGWVIKSERAAGNHTFVLEFDDGMWNYERVGRILEGVARLDEVLWVDVMFDMDDVVIVFSGGFE